MRCHWHFKVAIRHSGLQALSNRYACIQRCAMCYRDRSKADIDHLSLKLLQFLCFTEAGSFCKNSSTRGSVDTRRCCMVSAVYRTNCWPVSCVSWDCNRTKPSNLLPLKNNFSSVGVWNFTIWLMQVLQDRLLSRNHLRSNEWLKTPKSRIWLSLGCIYFEIRVSKIPRNSARVILAINTYFLADWQWRQKEDWRPMQPASQDASLGSLCQRRHL